MANNTDSRSTHTDALATLGTVIGDGEKRDAIHLGVEPVVAGAKLAPGEHIKFENGVAVAAKVGQGIGIVDPFLTKPVKAGERFWLIVYPRQITSLRHVWTHPDFPDTIDLPAAPEAPKVDLAHEASLDWIRKYAKDIDISYHTLMLAALNYQNDGDYLCEGDKFDGVSTDENFWHHYGIVMKTKVPEDKRHNFFSCSC